MSTSNSPTSRISDITRMYRILQKQKKLDKDLKNLDDDDVDFIPKTPSPPYPVKRKMLHSVGKHQDDLSKGLTEYDTNRLTQVNRVPYFVGTQMNVDRTNKTKRKKSKHNEETDHMIQLENGILESSSPVFNDKVNGSKFKKRKIKPVGLSSPVFNNKSSRPKGEKRKKEPSSSDFDSTSLSDYILDPADQRDLQFINRSTSESGQSSRNEASSSYTHVNRAKKVYAEPLIDLTHGEFDSSAIPSNETDTMIPFAYGSSATFQNDSSSSFYNLYSSSPTHSSDSEISTSDNEDTVPLYQRLINQKKEKSNFSKVKRSNDMISPPMNDSSIIGEAKKKSSTLFKKQKETRFDATVDVDPEDDEDIRRSLGARIKSQVKSQKRRLADYKEEKERQPVIIRSKKKNKKSPMRGVFDRKRLTATTSSSGATQGVDHDSSNPERTFAASTSITADMFDDSIEECSPFRGVSRMHTTPITHAARNVNFQSPDAAQLVEQMQRDEAYARQLQEEMDHEFASNMYANTETAIDDLSPLVLRTRAFSVPEQEPRGRRINRDVPPAFEEDETREHFFRNLLLRIETEYQERPSRRGRGRGRRRARGHGRMRGAYVGGLAYDDMNDMNVSADGSGNNYETLLQLSEQIGNVTGGGLRSTDINYLPTKVFQIEAKNKESDCNICMSEYENRDKLRILPCFHSFHMNCIDPWIKQNATCPICRVEVKVQ